MGLFELSSKFTQEVILASNITSITTSDDDGNKKTRKQVRTPSQTLRKRPSKSAGTLTSESLLSLPLGQNCNSQIPSSSSIPTAINLNNNTSTTQNGNGGVKVRSTKSLRHKSSSIRRHNGNPPSKVSVRSNTAVAIDRVDTEMDSAQKASSIFGTSTDQDLPSVSSLLAQPNTRIAQEPTSTKKSADGAMPSSPDIVSCESETDFSNPNKEPAVMGTKSNSDPDPPTMLTFHPVENHPNVARCQLLLCNISEQPVYFRLKSISTSIIQAYPSGDSVIAPKSQFRVLLLWSRETAYKDWNSAPNCKMIMATRFVAPGTLVPDLDRSATTTRLMGKIVFTRRAQLPTCQLLLHAMGPFDPCEASSPMSAESPAPNSNKDRSVGLGLADFLNNVTDRGLCVLLILVMLILLLSMK